MTTDTLLNTKQVRERLKISRSTLYAMMQRGQLKPVENEKPYLKKAPLLFREEDIERLLKGE